jgi:hypothetical protein
MGGWDCGGRQQRRREIPAGSLLALLVLLGIGCRQDSTPLQPVGAVLSDIEGTSTQSTPTAPAAPSTQPQMSDGVWAVNKAECLWCHTYEPFPHNIDLRTREAVLQSQIQLFYNGVNQEMAPAIHLLTDADRESLLAWAVQNGAQPATWMIPRTYDWSMDEQLAGAAEGSSAVAPGRFFAFDIEDSWIYGANVKGTSPLTVKTWTDNSGIGPFKGIALSRIRSVDPDSFPASTHPSFYGVPDGVPWHGRFKLMTFQGYVRQDRWSSFVVHTHRLAAPGRSHRDYVRFQIDRDAISIRSTPTATETWPWGGSASNPGPDGKLTGTLNKSGIYLSDSKWFFMRGSVSRDGTTIRYTLQVEDPVNGAVIASLAAARPDGPDVMGGFAFHKYSQNNAGKATMFARWEVHVTEIEGIESSSPSVAPRRNQQVAP